MKNITFYRLGEPQIGEVHSAFRDIATLREFIFGLPERNLVDMYEITGEVVEDEGTPDGLYVRVLDYKPFELI